MCTYNVCVYVYIFVSEEVFFPVLSLLKACLTFLLKLPFPEDQDWNFQRKSRTCYKSQEHVTNGMELTIAGALFGHLLSFKEYMTF